MSRQMAMTQEHFEALVGRLEDEAELSPRRYRSRLAAFALLGYGYIAAILALLIAAIAAVAWVAVSRPGVDALLLKTGIPALLLLVVFLKAMWIRLDSPRGLWLTRRKHPELFAAIDEIHRAAAAPRAHIVLMTDRFELSIAQNPRLGLFGWQKNYLSIGLPLMQQLSPDEFRAVLAHEFGHQSSARSRFSAWIYRIRSVWSRLQQRLQDDDHWGRFLFAPFFGWFAPRFAAYAFVEARQHEYDADQIAADVIGARPLANALLRIHLKAQELDRHYWPRIHAWSADEASPSLSPYSQLGKPENRVWHADAPTRMKEALMLRSDTTNLHPSLNERISALRVTVRLPDPPETTAADYLLGNSLPSLSEYFDARWRRKIAGWWSARHEQLQSRQRELAAMRRGQPDAMPDDELATLARLTEEIEGGRAAYPLYLMLAKRPSKPLGPRHAVGRLLLKSGNERGKQILDEIIGKDPNAVLPASEVIIPFLLARGRRDEAAPYIARYQKLRSELQRAEAARYRLRAADEYQAAGMSTGSLAKIQHVLSQHRSVRRAYLAQKALPDGEAPLFVVGVEPVRGLLSAGSPTRDRELCEEIATQVRIPEDTLFVPLNVRSKTFARKLRAMEGAKIFG